MKTSTQQLEPNSFPQRSCAAARQRSGGSGLAVFFVAFVFLLFGTTQTRAQGIPPGCSGSAIGISLFTSAPDVHVGDTLFYSVSVFNGIAGNPTSCDASNIVASLTTPDGVVHPITLRRTYLSHAQSDFYTNVVSYVVRAQDIRPDGTVRATAEDTAVIFQNDTPSNGGANQGVNTEVSQPCIQVLAQCVGGVGENGLITFTGTVTNCGNNTLVGVTVTNYVNGGGAFQVTFITNLLRGQSATFSGSYVPANPCGPNTAVLVAQGVDQFTSSPRTVTASSAIICGNTSTPGIFVTKSCPTEPVAPGQMLVFSGTVSNAGNVTLTNIVVVNDQPVSNTLVFTRASLAPGQVASFTGSYKAPTNCAVTDDLLATATSVCGVAVGHKAMATCPILTTPQLLVTALCATNPIVPGGLVTYGGTVRNSGDVTLVNVVVVSDRPSPNTVVFSGTLAPGASGAFNATYAVPQGVCSITTTFRGTGVSTCTGVATTNTTSATCLITTLPAIAVTLACPTAPVVPGGLITYTGTVRNSGTITLNNVRVVNNQPAPNTVVFTVATLAAGATANFTASFATPLDACAVSSTVIGSGADSCSGVVVSNTASATCTLITAPRIVVSQNCPVAPASGGGLLTYSGTVSNAGNVTLTNVVVTNDRTGATPVFTAATLAPGATANFTGSYTVPTSSGCSVTSTVTARGTDKCTGSNVTATATATCQVATAPAIEVTLTCPLIAPPLGGLLTYSGTVSNSGNVTLSNVVVLNNRTGATPIFTAASLAPGQIANFTGSYTVPPNCCTVSSTVTASGRDCNGIVATDTASSTCPVLTSPRLVVTKVCPTTAVEVGERLRYTGIVSNAGNITLVNVTVVNNQPSNGAPVIGPLTLAPGESASYVASYIVPPDFCGTDTLTARGTSICDVPVVEILTTTCPVLTAPQITVIKICPTQPARRGTLFIFTGSVSNSGNVTLTNVFVVNNQPAANTPVIGPLTLAPGASSNFTGSYIAPVDCCETIDTLTARGQDRCSGLTVTDTASQVCPLLTTPTIAVAQTCPPASQAIGTVWQFTGSVTNTGDINLTNVFVFSSQPNNTLLLGPIELAPGESEGFSGSYVITGGTNTIIVTNSSSTITTNTSTVIVTNNAGTVTTNNTSTVTTNAAGPTTFATINTVNQSVVDRFAIGTNFNGLTYAGEDHGYAATQFYAVRKDPSGVSFFDTITASTGTTTDRFNASSRNFDALAYAAPDVGYGPVIFYYLSHDNAGVSTFGTITPGGVVGVVTDRFVVGSNFDALTFSATDLGYGANLFYYVRHDATGLSTFGTINPALPGTVTDRFPVGTNVEALVFTDLVAPGYGPNNFYYLRRGANGVATFGTIFITSPTTAAVTDRFVVGTNANELTFTATDVGFGANLFYALRGRQAGVVTNTTTTYTTNTTTTFTTNTTTSYTTNMTTSFTTNRVVFTTPNTVTASGIDICQARTVTAQASCSGSSGQPGPAIGGPGAPPSSFSNGTYRGFFATQNGVSYTIQYKNSLNDATWTNLQTVTGTGGYMTITDVTGTRPMRFYRIITP